ncbi:Helix-turn-helix domain-containing protein [Gemmobacter aquatilis]|uniref:Helix-turn-helix domain-containing protein n=2 Tax=Gemmobacter aquatilis TaxID=933059 RepID=A0A1H8F478_9RHOB|nr:Helix-turn-helix domain-containing protein [Gemmobacter aquatilis]
MFDQTRAFALSEGNGRIRVDTAELRRNGPRVSHVQSTGHVVEVAEETAVTLLMPRAGHLRLRVAAAEYRMTQRGGLLVAPGARRTRVDAPDGGGLFRACAVMTPWADLRAQIADDIERDLPGLPDGLPILNSAPSYRRLSDLLDLVTGHFHDGAPPVSSQAVAALAVLVNELLRGIVVETVQTFDELRTLPAPARRVRLAEEIMRARSDEPLSMAEIAREVGVGLRSLQLAFMETRAMEPSTVLNRMRLERARDRLCAAQPGDSVTTIALDCGFTHLGRFSGAYRLAYGESPGETLTGARRRRS